MLNEDTMQKLHELKLGEMAAAIRNQSQDTSITKLTFEERFGMLVDLEWSKKKSKQLQYLTQKANMKFSNACLESIDYKAERKLNPEVISKLGNCNFLRDSLNIIISGVTGVGKTYMACAFGNAACRQRYSVSFQRVPQLLVDISMSKADGSYRKLMANLKRVKLLILDDWGLNTFDIGQSRDLLELFEARYQSGSTIFVSQINSEHWHELFS